MMFHRPVSENSDFGYRPLGWCAPKHDNGNRFAVAVGGTFKSGGAFKHDSLPRVECAAGPPVVSVILSFKDEDVPVQLDYAVYIRWTDFAGETISELAQIPEVVDIGSEISDCPYCVAPAKRAVL